jgi:opacity protein-like surface antigen
MSRTPRIFLHVLSIVIPVLAMGFPAFAQTPDAAPVPTAPPAAAPLPRAVISIDAGTAFGNTEAHWAYAGGLGVALGTHLQISAQVGRFDNIVTKALHNDIRDSSATLSGTLGSPVTPSSAVGAAYGTADVRLAHEMSPHIGVFLDAGAGIARVDPQFAATEAGTNVTGQVLEAIKVPVAETTVCASVGGGFSIRLGPRATVDAGYRFGRIGTTEPIDTNLLYGGWRLGW